MSNAHWDPGARCALHPDVQATGTCERCGNYVCSTCTGDASATQPLCPSCRARLGLTDFTLTRERTDFSSVFSTAWSTFTAHWAPLTLASVVYFAISFAFSFCTNVIQAFAGGMGEEARVVAAIVTFVLVIGQNLVLALVLLGLVRVCQEALASRAPSLRLLFSQASRFLPWLAQIIVVGLVIAVPIGALLAIPIGIGAALDAPEVGLAILAVLGVVLLGPMIYIGLGLYFGQFELVYDPTVGPIEALKRSWRLADGYRATIFGVALAGALVMAASFCVFCVGIIPGTMFFYLLIATLHKGLRNGSGLPEPVRTF